VFSLLHSSRRQETSKLTSRISNLGTDFVTIYVGKERKEYNIHKKVICDTADYFSKAFTGAFQEREGVMNLPEESPDAFGLFVDWLYKGIVPSVPSQKHLERLFKLYVFAEKLCLIELANKAMDKIKNLSECYPSAKTTTAMASYAFQNTFTDSPLRHWAVQDFVRHLDERRLPGIPNARLSEDLNHLCLKNDDFFEGYFSFLRMNDHEELPNPRENQSNCDFHRHRAEQTCYLEETDSDVLPQWVPSSESFCDDSLS